MGFRLTIARSSLRRRPARAFFSTLGVALGIAVAVSILTVDHTTLLRSQRPSLDVWKADIEARAKPDVRDAGQRLLEVPGVEAAIEVLQSDGRIVSLPAVKAGDREGHPVRVVALDSMRAPLMGFYGIETGEELDGEGGVLIGRRAAERTGVAVGDELIVARQARAPRSVCVDGQRVQREVESEAPVPARLRVRGILRFEGVGRTSNGDVVVVDIADGRRVFEGVFVEPSWWLARDPEVDVERTEQGLGEDFAFDLRKGAVIGQAADERAFRNGVRLSGLMALALGLFVIFHTLSMSLVERVREVAVLHAVGASRRQIGAAYFLEAVAITTAAGVLGLFGGLELARAMLNRGISSLGMTSVVKGEFEVPWDQVLPLVLLGTVVALLGSIFPLLKAGRSDTVQALRGEQEGGGEIGIARGFHLFAALLLVGVLPIIFFSVVDLVGEESRELIGVVLLGVGVLALLVGTPLVVPAIMGRLSRRIAEPFRRLAPFAGLLAGRAIERGPTRIAASVAAIALVTAAFVGLRGITRSLYFETDRWAEQAAVDRVWVGKLPHGTSWGSVAEAFSAYPGVVSVEIGNERISSPFRIAGGDVEYMSRFGPFADDPELARRFRDERGMVISRRLANQRGLDIGDKVPISTPGSGVQPVEVIAIDDSYGYQPNPHERAYGVVAMPFLEEFFCLDVDSVTLVSIVLEDGVDPYLVEAAAADILGPDARPEFTYGTTIRRVELADIERDFHVFDVILLLTALLAGVGVLNGQLLSAMERAKELGVLRALGADGRQIAGSVLLESTVIGLAGGVLGVALGSLLVPVIVRSLRVLSGLDLPQPGMGLGSALAPFAALVIAWLAAVYPIWKMGRMDPVRAVRTG